MNSRCALWSWLDQRAMLPPKCVGWACEPKNGYPGISSGFRRTPQKMVKNTPFLGVFHVPQLAKHASAR